jgi:hypothetical protein
MLHHMATFWFAMVAILNPKWPPKYKNPPDFKALIQRTQTLLYRLMVEYGMNRR